MAGTVTNEQCQHCYEKRSNMKGALVKDEIYVTEQQLTGDRAWP